MKTKQKVLKAILILMTFILCSVFSNVINNNFLASAESNSFAIMPPPPEKLSTNVIAQTSYYVSINGSDDNLGTQTSPFRTIEYAKMAINKFKAQVNQDMNIILMDGTYVLRDTISFGPEDKLPNGKKLTLKSANGARPVISGGTCVDNWQKVKYNNLNIMKSYIPSVSSVREFYVNNVSRNMAKTGWMEWIFDSDQEYNTILLNVMPKILNYFNIEEVKSNPLYSGATLKGDKLSVDKLHNAAQLEFVSTAEWRQFIARADKGVGTSLLIMGSSWDVITSQIKYMPGMRPFLPGDNFQDYRGLCFFQNDISLIKKPGDFAFDEINQQLYYYPLDGEDITQKTCFVPRMDNMLELTGTTENAVENITIEDITFMHGEQSWINSKGLSVDQANIVADGPATASGSFNKVRLKGNIRVNYANNIQFINCRFENSVSGAIQSDNSLNNLRIEGCIFNNIGEGAVQLKLVNNSIIQNNILRNCAKTTYSSCAIFVEDAVNSSISYNDISKTSYSGISIGLGWGYKPISNLVSRNITVANNRISEVMLALRDGGHIYTLDKLPGTVIKNNYLFGQGSSGNKTMLYFDQGSAGIVARNNVLESVPNAKNTIAVSRFFPNAAHNVFIENNYLNRADNEDNGISVSDTDLDGNKVNNRLINTFFEPNAISQSKWSSSARTVIENAGLQPQYRYLLNQVSDSPKLKG